MVEFGGFVHVAGLYHYRILKLHPNMSYNDATNLIFAKKTSARQISSLKMVVSCSVLTN